MVARAYATAQLPQYNLSKMAINILSTLAMSPEPKRPFSSVKNLINDKRMKCVKSWLKLEDFLSGGRGDVGDL